MSRNNLDIVTALSHAYGGDDYVKGGGGNTSFKDEATLWIKPSGTTLSGLSPDRFVKIDRSRLNAVYEMVAPADAAAREERVRNLLQDSVLDEGRGRPSVETPLHDLLRHAFVVHTHPPLVNGMTCAAEGGKAAARLFPEALWIPYTDPGYVLSMRVRDDVAEYERRHGVQPSIILLENHGIVVGGDSAEEVHTRYRHVMEVLGDCYRETGVSTALSRGRDPESDVVEEARGRLRALLGPEAIGGLVASGPCRIAEGPLTPDHMVYAKAFAFNGPWEAQPLRAFMDCHGYAPRLFSREDGLFAAGSSPARAELALALALDGALVVQLAEAFGGAQYMDDAARDFIENWEVEAYREKALGSSS